MARQPFYLFYTQVSSRQTDDSRIEVQEQQVSANGPDVFDRTINGTHAWLTEVTGNTRLERALPTVMTVLGDHIDGRQMTKVEEVLAKEVRALWQKD